MKQFKKLAAPLLAAALLMGTAACGGGGATSSAGTSSPDSSSPSADAVTFTVTADVTGDRAPYVERFAQLVEEKTKAVTLLPLLQLVLWALALIWPRCFRWARWMC